MEKRVNVDIKLSPPDGSSESVGEVLPGEFEVEQILGKKRIKVGRKFVLHYLVRWKGYTEKDDKWVRHTRLQAHRLVQEFENRLKTDKLAACWVDADSASESESTHLRSSSCRGGYLSCP